MGRGQRWSELSSRITIVFKRKWGQGQMKGLKVIGDESGSRRRTVRGDKRVKGHVGDICKDVWRIDLQYVSSCGFYLSWKSQISPCIRLKRERNTFQIWIIYLHLEGVLLCKIFSSILPLIFPALKSYQAINSYDWRQTYCIKLILKRKNIEKNVF